MTDIDKLEELAKAARPGPYAVERREIDCGYFDYIVHSGKGDVAWCREELDRKAKANAAYLAALDPATVLALVAECRELRKLREVLRFLSEKGFCGCRGSLNEAVQAAKVLGWKGGT